MDKKKLIEDAYNKAFYYEKNFRGCAQCTIASLFDVLNIRSNLLFKASSGLASGGGLTCEGSCGGFNGGILVMSSIFGRRFEFFDDDTDYKRTSFKMGRYLEDKFYSEFGSVICKDIHQKIFGRKYDLWDPQDKSQFSLDGSHETKCTHVVGISASWTVEIILNELEERNLTFDDIPILFRQ